MGVVVTFFWVRCAVYWNWRNSLNALLTLLLLLQLAGFRLAYFFRMMEEVLPLLFVSGKESCFFSAEAGEAVDPARKKWVEEAGFVLDLDGGVFSFRECDDDIGDIESSPIPPVGALIDALLGYPWTRDLPFLLLTWLTVLTPLGLAMFFNACSSFLVLEMTDLLSYCKPHWRISYAGSLANSKACTWWDRWIGGSWKTVRNLSELNCLYIEWNLSSWAWFIRRSNGSNYSSSSSSSVAALFSSSLF